MTLETIAMHYLFHEAVLNEIVIEKNKLRLCFSDGLFYKEDNAKEIIKTPACEVDIFVKNFDVKKYYHHFEITRIYKNKIEDIRLTDFLNILRDKKFKIYMEYYSYFARSIKFEGTLQDKFDIILTITDIDSLNIITK